MNKDYPVSRVLEHLVTTDEDGLPVEGEWFPIAGRKVGGTYPPLMLKKGEVYREKLVFIDGPPAVFKQWTEGEK